MEWNLPEPERIYLRELARKQAEYAALPVMEERRRMWYALNDGEANARPPFVIETWTFDRDFMPDNIFRCTSSTGRHLEAKLLANIRNHELIDDDKIVPDTFSYDWFTSIDELGVSMSSKHADDSEGVSLGYKIEHPIKDLERDLHLLKPATCSVDREGTMAWKAFLEDLFRDLLRVELQTADYSNNCLTQRVVFLMGMEAFFTAMYEQPEAVHRLMAFLRDNSLRMMRWAEAEGLLRVNNGSTSYASSYHFTRRLPSPGYKGGPARLCDMFSYADSQETVGVSPKMFNEFCFPYYRDVCEPAGLVYFGCCEPAHPLWGDISRLPHLKKVSISRWCDEKFMGDALRGTEVVFSRKPNPNFLSVDAQLDESAWAAHIRATLEATRGAATEFIVRDVYTLHGNIDNARRATEIAKREIDRCR